MIPFTETHQHQRYVDPYYKMREWLVWFSGGESCGRVGAGGVASEWYESRYRQEEQAMQMQPSLAVPARQLKPSAGMAWWCVQRQRALPMCLCTRDLEAGPRAAVPCLSSAAAAGSTAREPGASMTLSRLAEKLRLKILFANLWLKNIVY